LRAAVSHLIHLAKANGCAAVVVEDLDFADARAVGRETMGRGKRGKRFRRTVAGIPTGKLRDRLAGMCFHAGLALVSLTSTNSLTDASGGGQAVKRWGVVSW
jgi:hypothetical protein